MTLGFIGAGAITSSIVTGLHASDTPPSRIILSPRNPETASALAARFPAVHVAASNQDVLDQSETVVLAVRPQVAESVFEQLRFRPSHQAISVVATFTIERLRRLLSPAESITRAIPLPSAAQRRSLTALYPADESAFGLFQLVGSAFSVDSEDQFNALGAASSAVASYFAFADSVATWLVGRGLPRMAARNYVASILPSLHDEAEQQPDLGFRSMAVAHATPGGLNEQILRQLEAHGVFDTMTDALDQVMLRVIAPARGTGDQ